MTRVVPAALVAALVFVSLLPAQPQLVPPQKQKLLSHERPIFQPFVRHWLPHHTKSCNQHGVSPCNYGHNTPRRSHSVATLQGTPPEELTASIPAAPRATPVPTPMPLPMPDTLGLRLGFPPPPVIEISTPGAAPPVQRRNYLAPSCRVDLLTLDQMGIALFNNGNLLFSGRLHDEGGIEKQLSGHWITLTLRARLGHPNEMVEALHGRKGGPADGPVVWKIVHAQWLSARRPDTVVLTASADPALRALFGQITGFDVTLEYEAPELGDAFGSARP